MKVLVMSDTHGLLRPEVKNLLGQCDAVIHAGDFHTQNIIDEIQTSVQTGVSLYLVRGNNDGEWAAHLPTHLEFILDGIKFCVVHDKKDLPQNLKDCQAVIFGHSHRYLEERKEGRLYLNPGSCGRQRFRLDLTLAFLCLRNGEIAVERVGLSCRNGKSTEVLTHQNNLAGAIQNIMKRMDKGQTIGKISRDLKLEADFVEEICRIRVTHPGVTANGILDKIEVNQKIQKSRRRKENGSE